MTKENPATPQDGKRYDAETHQWIDVADLAPAEKKPKPAALLKSEPDTPATSETKE